MSARVGGGLDFPVSWLQMGCLLPIAQVWKGSGTISIWVRRAPVLGGLLLRFQDEPQREKAWRDGAVGEETVASHLAKTCPEVVVLHDRRMVRKPLFGDAKLVIRGRDKTKLVDGLKRQVEAVRAGPAVVEQDVPVGGCFCFFSTGPSSV